MKQTLIRKILSSFAVCLLVGASLSATTLASINQFTGRWENVDAKTRGITRFEISTMGGKVYFHAYGSCHPNDCDMGEAEATAYAQSVDASLSATAQALTVTSDHDFAETTTIIQIINGNRLRVETFTHFKDASKRSDYLSIETFARSSR